MSYPTFTTVNYYAGSRLNRVSWLRSSSDFLNRAVVSPHARFVLLDNGNPVIHSTDAKVLRLALFSWADVSAAVLRGAAAFGGSRVFGADAYALEHGNGVEKYWQRATEGIASPEANIVFLGIDEAQPRGVGNAAEPDGVPVFAAAIEGTFRDEVLAGPYQVLDMRTVVITGSLDAGDAALVSQARALLDWHARYVYCPSCGSRQYPVWGGHKRACGGSLTALAKDAPFVQRLGAKPAICPSTKSVQNYGYPRSDPVVIVGILSRDNERLLLSRQKAWPPGLYSCVAGFVEQGESLEEAVRREAYEEAGVDVQTVAYHSSQPWPFPANLIIGAYGIATSSDTRLDLDRELEDAFFATRDEVLALVARNKDNSPTRNGNRVYIPGPSAIAHVLMAGWASGAATVPGKL